MIGKVRGMDAFERTFTARNRPQLQMCTALPEKRKVVGLGGCGVDYLASVADFPKPDDKLRTEKLEVQGGGNCANALTAVARLGLEPYIFSKIGGDGLGDNILSELQQDGVNTDFMLRAAGYPSPFTYIIVDRKGGTRTCIHTPGADLKPEELPETAMDQLLADAALVYFDGRLTDTALKLAHHAKGKGIPLLVEAERLRPVLDILLALADYVVTSSHFPHDWTGEAKVGDAVVAMAQKLPAARVIITTLGSTGSVMLERLCDGQQASDVKYAVLQDLIDSMFADMRGSTRMAAAAADDGDDVACVSANGIEIRAGSTSSSTECMRLKFTGQRDVASSQKQAEDAASRAATLNAASGQGASYMSTNQGMTAAAEVVARVTVATAAQLPEGAVVDTTGAGDSFIGSVIYGLVSGKSMEDTLKLAAVVAACKCTALGARPGLPTRSMVDERLL